MPVAACGKKESGGEGAAKTGSGDQAAGGGAAKDLGAPTWKKMDKLGLQIEVPASAEFMDTGVDAPGAQFSVGLDDFSVRVNQTTPMYTDDFDKAKAEVEKDIGTKFVKWIKADKIEGGWHFEWQCESSMEAGKMYHGVQIRRTFGDKQVECWEKAPSAEAGARTVKACLSIKPV